MDYENSVFQEIWERMGEFQRRIPEAYLKTSQTSNMEHFAKQITAKSPPQMLDWILNTSMNSYIWMNYERSQEQLSFYLQK